MKRKNKIWLFILIPAIVAIIVMIFMVPSSCKKDRMLPRVTTTLVSNVTETSASCGGEVNSDGGDPVTARGVCWSAGGTPTIAANKTTDDYGTGNFTSRLTGLATNTLYTVCAYATNSAGTAYGVVLSFRTWAGSVTDIDGNVYHSIFIGNQFWMVENLKTKTFRDGIPIPFLSGPDNWETCSSPAYGYYLNDPTNISKFGAFYNWYAAGSGRLCPAGWHVPSYNEWQALVVSLGDTAVAGGKMKEAGTKHWANPNSGATNESGFSALAGGYLWPIHWGGGCMGESFPRFGGIDSTSTWWSNSIYSGYEVFIFILAYDNAKVSKYHYPQNAGLYVRCIRDN